MTRSKTKVICFGEVLWDKLPSGMKPGGAPMNVAVHLNQLGVQSSLISRVGADENGDALVEYIAERGVDTSLIQVDGVHSTGTVDADVSDPTEVKYTVNAPVAWDFIKPTYATQYAVGDADILLFGSIATRNDVSARTLDHLLGQARYRVLDVNLRAPHYTRERIEKLLQAADMVKMNDSELELIASWYSPASEPEEQMQKVAREFSLDTLCVTFGDKGAELLEKGRLFSHSGFVVKVADTIGAGDAFLAALLAQRLEGKDPDSALEYACATGACVASSAGATPVVSEQAIRNVLGLEVGSRQKQ